MKSNLTKTGLAGLLSLTVAGCLSASIMVNVGGNQDIYLAGQSSSPSSDAGVLPTVGVAGGFAAVGPTFALQVFGVTGSVSPCVFSVGCPTSSPSAPGNGVSATPPGTDITGAPTGVTSTLSAIQFSGEAMFLVAVFLNGSTLPSGSQVAQMPDYGVGGNSTLATYSPTLGQVFFVGDGVVGTTEQNFLVPVGATQVYFGFADSSGGTTGFTGPASSFGDDGSCSSTPLSCLSVNLQIVPVSASGVPEPGTIVLFALGLAGIAVGRRMRSA